MTGRSSHARRSPGFSGTGSGGARCCGSRKLRRRVQSKTAQGRLEWSILGSGSAGLVEAWLWVGWVLRFLARGQMDSEKAGRDRLFAGEERTHEHIDVFEHRGPVGSPRRMRFFLELFCDGVPGTSNGDCAPTRGRRAKRSWVKRDRTALQRPSKGIWPILKIGLFTGKKLSSEIIQERQNRLSCKIDWQDQLETLKVSGWGHFANCC